MHEKLRTLAKNWPVEIPFERAVRCRWRDLNDLLSEGITWPTIAQALTAFGVRKKAGGSMTSKQMNTVFLRASKTRFEPSEIEPVSPRTAAPVRFSSGRARSITAPPPAPRPERTTQLDNAAPATMATPTTFASALSQRLSEAARLKNSRRLSFEE